MAVNGTETGAFGGSSLFGPVQNATTNPPLTVNVPSFKESINHARDVNQAPISTGWRLFTGAPIGRSILAYYYRGTKYLLAVAPSGYIWTGPNTNYPQGALFGQSQFDGSSLEPGFIGLPWYVFPNSLLPFEDPERICMGTGWQKFGADYPQANFIPVTEAFNWISGFGVGNAMVARFNQIMLPGQYNATVQIWSSLAGVGVPNYTTVKLEIVSVDGKSRADVTPGNIDYSASFAGLGNNIPFSFQSSSFFAGGFYFQITTGNMPNPELIAPLPPGITFPQEGSPFGYFNWDVQCYGNRVGP